jgi:hypothetical protein
LLDVPEFVAAQDLAEETFETGVIPRAHFEASCFSAEFNLVNQMLHQGTDPSGAVFSQPRLLRLIDTPGFVDWYKNLTAGS